LVQVVNLSVKDAAEILRVSEKTVYRWIKQGNIPAYRVNEQYRFNRAEILEWATSRRINLAPELFLVPDAGADSLPTLSDALEAGGILYRVEGSTRNDALAQMVRHLRLPDEVKRDYLLQLLIAQEYLASTGVGGGIALPHVRHPELLFVPRALATICFLEAPVDFQALDGEPVRILLHFIAPTLRAQEHLKSVLGFVVRNVEFARVLREEGSREEILSAVRTAESSLRHRCCPQ